MATNQGFKSFVPKPSLDASYLYWWLKANRARLNDLGNGATFKEVSKAVVARVLIPLPPIGRQRCIAAILDKAHEIRHKREQVLAMADELLKSVFLEMFGTPATNPNRLPTIALGDLIKVSSGNGLIAKNMARDGGFPVYGGNGINGYHSEYMFEEPQLVIGRVGVYCGAIHLTEPRCWVTDNALYVREFKKPVDLIYLEWALRFANLNQYAGRSAQPLISGGRIYPIEIILPDRAAQEKFRQLVDRQKKAIDNLAIGLTHSDKLFASLSQRAFTANFEVPRCV